MWRIPEQCSKHCWPVLSHSLFYLVQNLLSELWLGYTVSAWDPLATALLIKTRHNTLIAKNNAKANFRRLVFLSTASY